MRKKIKKDEAKPRLGRPKSAVQRSKWLPVRVSDDEIEAVKESASGAGMPLSAWVRRRLGLPGTGYGDKVAEEKC